ncbi:MAG: hypothetical protein K2X31_06820 [Sphingopyxis sp.]|nr:hypothetical protein [Sphingopyxis sp.]
MTLSQRIVESSDLAEALSYWATALGIVVAIGAGLFSLWQSSIDRRHQRLMRARELYDDYLKMSMDHPHFFMNFWDQQNVTDLERERYVGFVSYMLNGIEDMLVFDGRAPWHESLKGDLRFHQSYLRSVEFAKLLPGYFGETQALIRAVIEEPDFFEASPNA